jgi:hypothetical protein
MESKTLTTLMFLASVGVVAILQTLGIIAGLQNIIARLLS